MNRSFVRAFAAFSVAGVALSCNHDAEVLGIPDSADDMFRSYVAIGNSITAGYQSDGINATLQAQSYAVLLSRQMQTRFAIPALALPGCQPPIVNWTTGARLGTPPAPPCALRDANSATDILNNVAVPGAASSEVNAPTSPFHNTLTTLFLGGKTQVQRGLEASPTFATIWIGNNDVLQAAITGLLNPTAGVSRGITPVPTFTANYDAMINALDAGAPDLKGALIGVVQTAGTPLLFPVSELISDATYRAQFDAAAGFSATSSDPFKSAPLSIHPNCNAAPTTLISFAIVPQIAAFRNSTQANPALRPGHPPVIQCGSTDPEGPTVGHIFILTPTEQATLAATVGQYNTHIQAKATQLDFAYADPNALLQAQRVTGGCIALRPNVTANPTTGAPFGTCMSFDGVHPGPAGHVLIANALIAAINLKYGTTLTAVP